MVLPGEWPLCGHRQITVKDGIVYFVDEFDAGLGWVGLWGPVARAAPMRG